MFALGIRTCLAESALVQVAHVVDEDVDVVIVSPRMAEEQRFAAPLVICGEPPKRLAPGNEVMAVLGRATLTADHLLASIHAAAAGLRVVQEEHTASPRLAGRGLEVLALLASGADTKEIAEQLGYSDRTIKSVIRDVQQRLGSRTACKRWRRGSGKASSDPRSSARFPDWSPGRETRAFGGKWTGVDRVPHCTAATSKSRSEGIYALGGATVWIRA